MSAKAPRWQVGSTNPGAGAASLLDELTGTAAAPAADPQPPPAPRSSARPTKGKSPSGARRPRSGREPHPEPEQFETAAGPRTPIRVQVPTELADRVRGAVAALAYQEESWSSLNAATTAALERFVAAAEKTHNNGEPFPWAPGRQLQPGRRVGY